MRRKKGNKKNTLTGRVKFYADEDVPMQLIKYIRNRHRVNITSAVEMGFTGRDDMFQFQEAKHQHRFLLTCDKGFLNHSKYPFKQMLGIVILDIPPEPPGLGWMSMWLESEIVPSGKEVLGTKIVIHTNTFEVHFVNDSGKIEKQVLRPLKVGLDK